MELFAIFIHMASAHLTLIIFLGHAKISARDSKQLLSLCQFLIPRFQGAEIIGIF